MHVAISPQLVKQMALAAGYATPSKAQAVKACRREAKPRHVAWPYLTSALCDGRGGTDTASSNRMTFWDMGFRDPDYITCKSCRALLPALGLSIMFAHFNESRLA